VERVRSRFWDTENSMTPQKQLNTLIGDEVIEHPHYAEIIKTVMRYIEKAMKERKTRQGVKSEQHGYSAPSL